MRKKESSHHCGCHRRPSRRHRSRHFNVHVVMKRSSMFVVVVTFNIFFLSLCVTITTRSLAQEVLADDNDGDSENRMKGSAIIDTDVSEQSSKDDNELEDEERSNREKQKQRSAVASSSFRRLAYACTDVDDCQRRLKKCGSNSLGLVGVRNIDDGEIENGGGSRAPSSSSSSSSSCSTVSIAEIQYDDDEPKTFEGMTLQVFTPLLVIEEDYHDRRDRDREKSDDKHFFHESERIGNKKDAEGGPLTPVVSATTKPTTPVTSSSSSSSVKTNYIWERSYLLAEPVQLDLGIVPKHYLDFAYTPVVASSPSSSSLMMLGTDQYSYNEDGSDEGDGDSDNRISRDRDNDDSDDPSLHQQMDLDIYRSSTTTFRQDNQRTEDDNDNDDVDDDNSDDQATCKVLVASTPDISSQNDPQFSLPSSSEWWTWWFPNFSRYWWNTHGSTPRDFNTDKTAFAGGSHGQVWRGRRVCNGHHDAEAATQKAAFVQRHQHSGRRTTESRDDDCDDSKQLILKRLRVGQGHRLLEAGLREVYFGNLIDEQMEPWQQERYTVYVDHFYREVPRAFGRVQTKDLELWIVFEDAGPSLRSYMYTATSSGSFIMYQHSKLWTQLRMSTNAKGRRQQNQSELSSDAPQKNDNEEQQAKITNVGREIMRSILHQIISAAAHLHEKGIVHRDIKPSNVMCFSDQELNDLSNLTRAPHVHCRLGDFSSGWDDYTRRNLYTKGPSPAEQTDEYAPPESYLGHDWVAFDKNYPHSYDSWSIGVLALELLLGTPNVFSVDQRTNALVTNRMRRSGATDDEIAHALYYAALSQYCISPNGQNWPLRDGDPLNRAEMAKQSCNLQDFHRALRARDPLGVGFDSSSDLLLHLIWQLLAFYPSERMTAKAALDHPYFSSPLGTGEILFSTIENALESQMLDPRLDLHFEDDIHNFTCPKCGRVFDDWRSCLKHAHARRHAKFCTYETSNLPTCINTHSMLPPHPKSGYCDLQGRRPTIEDFHSIHLYHNHQFYAVMDGHTTNFASKWLASKLYEELMNRLPILSPNESTILSSSIKTSLSDLKDDMKRNISAAFSDLHERFLEDVAVLSTLVIETESAPRIDQSGTTATALLVTDQLIVVASLGDSRAVMSSTSSSQPAVDWSLKDNLPGFKAIQLTKDHVAADPHERSLVLERGGSVFSLNGPNGLPRVNGTLAITRSIGDADLSSVLSREPHVLILDQKEIQEVCGAFGRPIISSTENNNIFFNIPCFVILASDGLWDVVSNEEAVEMVVEVLLSQSQPKSGGDWNDNDQPDSVTAASDRSTDMPDAEGIATPITPRSDGTAPSRSKSSTATRYTANQSHHYEQKIGMYQRAAELLAVEAYVRGSSDNIGVCVVEVQ